MEGNLVGSDEQNTRGQMTFRGQQIDALELIGYHP
jgi:hypothetical protein